MGRVPRPTGDDLIGSSGGSVQALKKVDVLAQSVVGSITLFRLETQHVHQLVVPCVRDSGIHLHSDSLRWRNHPLLGPSKNSDPILSRKTGPPKACEPCPVR